MSVDIVNVGEGTAVQKIIAQGLVQAIIVRGSLPHKGYNFVSQDTDTLQVGVNHYLAGSKARPHFHPPLERKISATGEVLHIDSGSCVLFLYDDKQQRIFETSLVGGDTVILLSGGHSLEFKEATRIVEVKQGPYYGAEKDKVFFEYNK